MKLSAEDWADAGLAALAEGGVRAVAIEPLARRLGVTKGSFYHHFKDRRALHRAILARFVDRATEAVIRRTEATSERPWARLDELMWTVFAPDPTHDRLEATIRAWAQQDEEVAEVLARVDERRVAYVAELLEGAGLPSASARSRSVLLYRVLIGEFTWVGQGGGYLRGADLVELAAMLRTEAPPGPVEMFPLPEGLVVTRQTPTFDERSIPAGLLGRHNTRAGVWGRIVVTEGRLRYTVEDGPSWVLEPGVAGVVRPQEWHSVRPLGRVRFHVEFLGRA